MIMSLVACIFVPELYIKRFLRSRLRPVNRLAIALPETIRLDIQQLDLAIWKSDADVKRTLRFDVLAHHTPLL